MKAVTVSDLRNDFARVERLLRKGQTLQITKRGKVVARLTAERAARLKVNSMA